MDTLVIRICRALGPAIIAALLASAPALATPAAYSLQPDRSTVGFQWSMGPQKIDGKMPVASAELSLDFANVAASTVSVALDVSHAEAGFPFASQAMKGPEMLDAAQFPQITFRSTKVSKNGDGARVEGLVTIHGVTRPVVLDAKLYRQRGTQAGDLSHLSLLLTGSVKRSDFGVDGWHDMVGDVVTLNILARIAKAP